MNARLPTQQDPMRAHRRTARAHGFQAELEKAAFIHPLRLATRSLSAILNPISSATRKGLMAAGGGAADLGLKGAIYPMKMFSRHVMAGSGLRGKAMRAGAAIGGGLTAYDMGQTTRGNLGGGVYGGRRS